MDAKLKTRWVKALESGKYKQGTQRLAGGGYYCCLGVLRKIEPSVRRHLQATETLDTKSSGIDGLSQGKLIIMNDEEKASFKEISQWIRAHL